MWLKACITEVAVLGIHLVPGYCPTIPLLGDHTLKWRKAIAVNIKLHANLFLYLPYLFTF